MDTDESYWCTRVQPISLSVSTDSWFNEKVLPTTEHTGESKTSGGANIVQEALKKTCRNKVVASRGGKVGNHSGNLFLKQKRAK